MKVLIFLVLALSIAVVTDAAERVKLVVGDVVREIGARQVAGKATAGEGVEVRVKDAHKTAKDCSAKWYETDVVCSGPVQFKGHDSCSVPSSVIDVRGSDCGSSLKRREIRFSNGKKVTIHKTRESVVVDYD